MDLVVVEQTPSEEQMLAAFANFLRIDVANGDASADTLRTYRAQVGAWVQWCGEHGINPATATAMDVKTYRQALVTDGYKLQSVAFKLTLVRRFYDAAKEAGYRPDNPAAGVKAPRSKKAADDLVVFQVSYYTK
jgi:site-specific recombinase XerD